MEFITHGGFIYLLSIVAIWFAFAADRERQ